jgi:hypothetical protein
MDVSYKGLRAMYTPGRTADSVSFTLVLCDRSLRIKNNTVPALSAKLATQTVTDKESLQVTVPLKKSESCSGKTQEGLSVKYRGRETEAAGDRKLKYCTKNIANFIDTK